jgi:hypothetical protein
MKKFLLFLTLVFAFASTAEAQKNVAPKLDSKEPSFAGFTGSFVKFGAVSGGNRSFTLNVEYKPWFFEISGAANAGINTEDLDILLEDIVAVVAYYDAKGKAEDTDYQAGIFDAMLYLEDNPINVSNLKITLKGKAASGASVLNQAQKWNFEKGEVFKNQKYSNAVFRAQAATLDKSDIEREQKAEKKRVADSIAREEKKVADSIAKIEKRKRDSIAAEKKRVSDSIAEVKALEEKARRKAAAEKKRKAEEEQEELSRKKTKKKKPAVEEDDEDEKPRKKTKKRKVVVEEDEDDDPPLKKKRKKKKE